MMDEWEKSDRPTVPTKSPNKARQPAAEEMEESGLAKRNLDQSNTLRMQGRVSVSNRLERVRQAAQRDSRMKFTALLHHVYALDMLREAYYDLKRDAAAGVDEETWQQYGQDLEGNLQDLSDRLKRGAYRALPVRRVYIPKADGRQRPLGVPVVEDKIVQRATVAVLNAIYETEFLGFSYGFRPGRSQHNALDALNVGLMKRQVNWVLDADIRGFFEAISHEWLVKFVEHRIGDGPARHTPDPEMVEGGRARKWDVDTAGRRDPAGRQCVAPAGERLPALCVRSVGTTMATKVGER